MIQSSRGQLIFPTENTFGSSATPRNINTTSVISNNTTPIHNTNIDHTNQLVWTNPIRAHINPQNTRQISYFETLLHMAQSTKTPLGVNPFWDSGATPPVEWKQCFATLKMAIMARKKVEVEKLLKLKPQPADLFYPTLPSYEEDLEGGTDEEGRQREQRNERRRVDFENECKVIESKGALVDRIPCYEADKKTKSLIYLSLGAEARQTYYQKKPHAQIEKCTTHELVHELNIIFTISETPHSTDLNFSYLCNTTRINGNIS